MTRSRAFAFATVLAMLSTAHLCGGCNTSNAKPVAAVEQTATVYDRVMKCGTIRCAYVIYKPGCIKDANSGKLSGIGVEVLELIAKDLGLKIEWVEEAGWGTMLEGLQTDRYDIVATPVWTHAGRARVAGFSHPLYYSPVCAYVKGNDTKFAGNDLSILNSDKYSIGTIDGATAEQIAKEDFPKARRVSLSQLSDFSQLMMTVSTGKADITFSEPLNAMDFLKHNSGSIKQVATKTPVRIFPNCWVMKRGQTEFKSMLDTVLIQLLNCGTVDKIIAKYEPAPNAVYRVAVPYQAPSK